MGLDTAKILGIIGVILEIIGGFFQGVGSIVGLVLVIIAVYMVSKETNRSDIFNNYIIYFVLAIVAIGVFFVGVLSTILAMGIGRAGFFTPGMGGGADLLKIIGAILVWLVIAWIVLIIGTYFLMKSYSGIAEALNHGTFRLAGKLYFFGAILLVILIGAILIIAGVIVELIAWATMPTELPKKPGEAPPPTTGEAGMGEPVI